MQIELWMTLTVGQSFGIIVCNNYLMKCPVFAFPVAALPATHNQTLQLRRTVCGEGGGVSGDDNDQVTQAAGKV
jgi:hypothetical protein